MASTTENHTRAYYMARTIAKVQRKHRVSAKAVAEALGISNKTLTHWANGQCAPQNDRIFLDAKEMLADFLDDSTPKPVEFTDSRQFSEKRIMRALEKAKRYARERGVIKGRKQKQETAVTGTEDLLRDIAEFAKYYPDEAEFLVEKVETNAAPFWHSLFKHATKNGNLTPKQLRAIRRTMPTPPTPPTPPVTRVSALDVQIGGTHYKDSKIQPGFYSEVNGLSFFEGCVVKRVTRHDKPTGKGLEDIDKAIHELQLIREIRYGQ